MAQPRKIHFEHNFNKAHCTGRALAKHRWLNLSPEWQLMVVCMVGPAYPSVRMLLTAEANHNTCLGEITAGSARVFKGFCFIKTEVPVQAVTTTNTQAYVWQEKECDACLYMVCVCVRVCVCGHGCLSNKCLTYRASERKRC